MPLRLQIPRVDGLSKEVFERDYRSQGKPVVFTGSIKHWPALSKWTFAFFKERFGNLPVTAALDLPDREIPYSVPQRLHNKDMTLGEFIHHLEGAPARPCYVHQRPIDLFPGLRDDLDYTVLTDDFARAPLVTLWFGSAGTFSGLHFDGDDNLYTQIVGAKRVLLVDPSQARLLYPYKWDFCKSQVDAELPDLKKFPAFEEATVYETDLKSGEVLFMPRVWWHQLRSLAPTISIGHNFGEAFRLGEHTRVLNQLGIAYWAEILKQVMVNGVLGVEMDNPLYSYAPPGKMFYDYVKEEIADRLGLGAGK
ncbi:MAG TPA: cupin-like domain-containing protein [Myxococcaceae bacterium]|jgi:lysine-specific demethylase 8